MMRRFIFVHGTWGAEDRWHFPSSPLAHAFSSRGVYPISYDDPFRWTGHVEGVDRNPDEWGRAGDSLRWHAEAKKYRDHDLVVVAHSHGGQVAAFAASQGLEIGTLVTISTPFRNDLEDVYQDAKKSIGRWVHMLSPGLSDRFQVLGALFDGHFGVQRHMPLADVNLQTPGMGHSGMLDPANWTPETWGIVLE